MICYALRGKDIFRFVADADADRWRTDAQAIHRVAIENLSRLDWPTELEGARLQDGGRVILIVTGDGLASSRLLHPGLHDLLRGPLGSPFRAGIPDRDTLVAYTDRHRTRLQTERQLRKDHRKSGYPITPRPFLVTPDGIGAGPGLIRVARAAGARGTPQQERLTAVLSPSRHGRQPRSRRRVSAVGRGRSGVGGPRCGIPPRPMMRAPATNRAQDAADPVKSRCMTSSTVGGPRGSSGQTDSPSVNRS